MLTLADIMITAVVTVDMDDSIARIRDIFAETKFHHLVVLEEGRIAGIVSDRDILKHLSPFLGRTLMERGQDLNTLKLRAHQIMTRRVFTATPETPAREAADMLLEHRVSCLPVALPDRRLAGIVTWRDLLPHCFGCAA